MDAYKFDPEETYETISRHWTQWAQVVGAKKWVVGISGGKDSTVVAALAARIFGNDNVIGIMMPNGEQKDISDSISVCEFLKIQNFTVNIKNCFGGLIQELETNCFNRIGISKPSYDTITNLPARLRMATLYAVAQTINGGIVLNTCNLSEDVCGYATLYGDNAGSYAPIQGLTVTEIRQLGDWLGLPHDLVHKVPVDGLQDKTDEEKLGFKYEDLDRYIREDIGTEEFKTKIDTIYRNNRFKTDIVQIPRPNFEYLGNFVRYHNLPDISVQDIPVEPLDILRVNAEPRYPEDAEINDVREDNDNPKMPFLVKEEGTQDGWCWKIDIDIATGEIIGWPKDINAAIHYKVCDCFGMKYEDLEYRDYVPDFMAIDDEGYGDYIILTIEDGKIKDWNADDCRKFIERIRKCQNETI